jgi:protocatechuate 3,4-dioxygenase beta subunit
MPAPLPADDRSDAAAPADVSAVSAPSPATPATPVPAAVRRSTVSRRAALGGMGALGLSAVAAACGAGGSSSSSGSAAGSGSATSGSTGGAGTSPSTSAATAAGGSATTGGAAASGGSASPAACTLTPEQTEGPYYLDIDMVRRDITEGKPGTPLELEVQVLDSDGCTPRRDVAVDIWHCDAGGDYSGVSDEIQSGSDTFLRGTQVTDGDGKVTFATIWPGFYPGRAVHIHMKVHPTSTSEVTTQLYFPDGANAEVFTAAPYSSHQGTVTTNARDGIYGDGGSQLTLSPTRQGDGYRATFVAAVGDTGSGSSSAGGQRGARRRG